VVGLRKLRQFQERGHTIVLIVGDWTAQIGDPSGQSLTRPMLTAEAVKANALTYLEQFFKVVDKSRTEVRWQSEWYGNFKLDDIIRLTSKFTVAQLLARDDFAKRYAAEKPIAVTEFLYPLLQAYDSVYIRADVEFGGTDQRFNNLLGRELQQMMGQPPQQVFLMPLLVGTDGTQKMSKSLDNYIGVDEPPNDMYGKVMSIPDTVLIDYFTLITDVPDKEIDEYEKAMTNNAVNPMELKKKLAYEIVKQFHTVEAAAAAADNFSKVFQQRQAPDEEAIVKLEVQGTLTAELTRVGLTKSRADAKRLISQGGIEIEGQKVTEDIEMTSVKKGALIKVGKRRFASI
jgi:tyrosyl-tRNA synthetase